MLRQLGGEGAIQDAMFAAELSIAAIAITGFALTVIGHHGNDEVGGLTEQVLSTAASRRSAWLSALTVCLLGTAWLLFVTGLGAAAGLGDRFGDLAWAGLGQVPAVWLVSALGLLILGLSGRRTWLAWGILGAFLVLGLMGELLRLPAWVVRLSPYYRAPRLPGGDIDWVTQAVMLGLAAVALAAGWWFYARRDIA